MTIAKIHQINIVHQKKVKMFQKVLKGVTIKDREEPRMKNSKREAKKR